MAAAQASVGKAAAWPTTGTILITALLTRQGAASTPQPDSVAVNNKMAIEVFIMARKQKKEKERRILFRCPAMKKGET